MNITLLVIGIILSLICLKQIFNVFVLNINKTQKFIYIVSVVSVFLIIYHVVYSLLIYYNLYKMRGDTGPKGIKGLRGLSGDDGSCNADCGKDLCLNECRDAIEKLMRKNNITGEFQNDFYLRRIDTIVNSDKYENAVNLSNEKEIIDYVIDTISKWTVLIINTGDLGKQFLTTKSATDALFDSLSPADKDNAYNKDPEKSKNPFDEIKKYEIWSWSSDYTFRPIVRRQCNPINEVPGTLPAPVNILFSDNYDKTNYVVPKPPKTKWGPDNDTECPYGQLGEDHSNPREIDFCYKYTESTQNIQMIPVWKQLEYLDFEKGISFYNLDSAKLQNQTMFPVGSVWRGTDNTERAQFDDAIGPPKKTILISGAKVKEVDYYRLIWPTKANDDLAKKLNIYIWRGFFKPENKGFVSLGDVVTKINVPPKGYYGVHKDCLEEVDFKDKPIWTSNGLGMIERDKIKSKPKTTRMKTDFSIWPVGIQDKSEEKNYFTNETLDSYLNIGYNLFRASPSLDKKPLQKGYTIKSNCTIQVKTKDKDVPDEELGIGWYSVDKSTLRDNAESVFTNLGFTPTGIIESQDKKEKYFIDFIKSANIEQKNYAIRTQEKSVIKYFDASRQLHDVKDLMDGGKGIPDKFKWTIENLVNNNKEYTVQFKTVKQYSNPEDPDDYYFKDAENKKTWLFFPSTGWK